MWKYEQINLLEIFISCWKQQPNKTRDLYQTPQNNTQSGQMKKSSQQILMLLYCVTLNIKL